MNRETIVCAMRHICFEVWKFSSIAVVSVMLILTTDTAIALQDDSVTGISSSVGGEVALPRDSTTSDSATDEPEIDQHAEVPEWAQGELADCVACHSRIIDESGNTIGLYSSHGSFTCFDCHNDPVLAELHEDADEAKGQKVRKLKKTEVTVPNCSACHDQESLAEALISSTVLTDANGTCVNPHAIPQIEPHQIISCFNCHAIHTEDSNVDKAAQKTCASCHHANVYECGTCHSNE